MINRRMFCTASTGLVLAGCAAPPMTPVKKYQWGEVVDFEGLSFTFNSARSTKRFMYTPYQGASSETGFVIVDISATNKTAKPLRHDFQPVYRLMDAAGSVYEHSLQATVQINIQRGGVNLLESINPGTTQRREYVFEAPQGSYDLQVMVPSSLQMAFAGSIQKTGPYFLVDISSQLQ